MRRNGRRSNRLPGYDYRLDGWYFVTVCTRGREHIFGEVVAGRMNLNAAGRIVYSALCNLRQRRNRVAADTFVVMPDHLHVVLAIDSCEAGTRNTTSEIPPTSLIRRAPPGSVGTTVMNFKSVTARRINRLRNSPGAHVWQRNYWERVIRNEAELYLTRQYIAENPVRWQARQS